MANLQQCEFFLLRYVPDAVKNEFVNIGVLMLPDQEDGSGEAPKLRFTRDWSRVRCMDPAADVEMLQALEADISRQLAADNPGRALILKRLEDSFSNLVQISTRIPCLTESPEQEMETLARLYLESPARKGAREQTASARSRIVMFMRDAFEQAGVWPLMLKKVAVRDYTGTGDPLRIDCGYRPNGTVKLFHAVSVETDVDSAKVLAFSFPRLQRGIESKLQARAELTAVIEDQFLQSEDDQVKFALATLRGSSIAVAGTAELPRLADVARREMRV